jgi:hypothetical protein
MNVTERKDCAIAVMGKDILEDTVLRINEPTMSQSRKTSRPDELAESQDH